MKEAYHASRVASLDAFKVYADMKQGQVSAVLDKLIAMNPFGSEGEQAIAGIVLKRVTTDEQAELVLPQVIGMVQGLDAKLSVYLRHKNLIKDVQVRLKIINSLSKEFELDDHVILSVAKVKLTRAINGDYDKTLSKGLMVELQALKVAETADEFIKAQQMRYLGKAKGLILQEMLRQSNSKTAKSYLKQCLHQWSTQQGFCEALLMAAIKSSDASFIEDSVLPAIKLMAFNKLSAKLFNTIRTRYSHVKSLLIENYQVQLACYAYCHDTQLWLDYLSLLPK